MSRLIVYANTMLIKKGWLDQDDVLEYSCKPQTAVNWNEFFFIAVRDAKERAAIPGTYWGKGCTSEGTVTVLVLADQTASQAEHKAKYEGYYMKTVFSYFDTGMACAFLTLAANDLGYSTHFFGTMNGASVGPKPGKCRGSRYSPSFGLLGP